LTLASSEHFWWWTRKCFYRHGEGNVHGIMEGWRDGIWDESGYIEGVSRAKILCTPFPIIPVFQYSDEKKGGWR